MPGVLELGMSRMREMAGGLRLDHKGLERGEHNRKTVLAVDTAAGRTMKYRSGLILRPTFFC